MPLEFRRRRFRKPGKKGQYALALLALLAVIAVVCFWVAVRLHQPSAPEESTSGDTSADDPQADPSWEPAYLLVLITDEEAPRAVLLRSDPYKGAMQATPLPVNARVQEDTQLYALYRKQGAAAVTAALADTLEIPLQHYMAMRYDQVESWLNYLENGLVLTLPEAVQYASLRLEAGEHNLTATQAVSLLQYTGWQDAARAEQIAADALCAMLNQYLTAARYLAGDFAALSNLCRTSLRIGDFTAGKDRLTYLAEQNAGSLCRTVTPEWKRTGDMVTLDGSVYTRAVTHR